jgi:hypothetical protein
MAGISEYAVIIAKSSGESRVKGRGHDWYAAAADWLRRPTLYGE